VELRLEFLPAEDVAAYVAGRLGGPVAAPLTTCIHERTDGSALFMVNIVEHLVQQGLVVRHEGEWTLREGAEAKVASLPEELRQLLVRRIEALPPEVRRVLEAASVVGEEFAVAVVAAAAQSPVEDVEARCEGLAAQHHFVDDTGLAGWPDEPSGGSYRFQHALYQQVLYEQVGTARRAQLHRRIGGRLESGYGGRVGEVAARAHLEQSLELSPGQQPSTPISAAGLHPRIASLVWLVRVLWILGYVDQAQRRSREALALARQAGSRPRSPGANLWLVHRGL
jgi:hypothetical protein